MNIFRMLLKYLSEEKYRFFVNSDVGLNKYMDDAKYLSKYYYYKMGHPLNLDSPKAFSEKLQWLKLYDRRPEYTTMVDKYAVKDFVAHIIGNQYIIPTLGVWDKVEDIDFSKLPNQFVLKCTHDSHGLIICKDKSKLNTSAAKKTLKKALHRNYYSAYREWPYKEVPPRIIAEKYMEDTETSELRDYKFFCFNGEVKALFIASERYSGTTETKFDFFDEDFNHLPFTNGHPNSEQAIKKPTQFELMKEIASKLSRGIPHVRVDLYEVNGKVYFGELTFYHWSGLMPFSPEEWDYTFGSWLQLPEK